MRITSVYYTHKPGGFCKRLYRLLNALASRGHEVHYLTLDGPPPELSQTIIVHRMPFPLSSRSGMVFWALFSLFLPLLLFFYVRRLRPERLLAFSTYYAAAFGLASRTFRVPLVLFVRTKLSLGLVSLHALLDSIGLRLAQRICVQTKIQERDVRSVASRGSSSVTVLPNDIPEADIVAHDFPSNVPYVALAACILATTRHYRQKNIELLIEAFGLLEREHPGRFVLRIVGAVHVPSSIQSRIQNASNVEAGGWSENMSEEYRNANVFIHPALHEGMPNAVLEALSVGLPVLVAATPELSELVQDPLLAFDAHDARAIAKAVIAAFSSEEVYKALVRASQRVKARLTFDWDSEAVVVVVS